jgi:hypothetical protein
MIKFKQPDIPSSFGGGVRQNKRFFRVHPRIWNRDLGIFPSSFHKTKIQLSIKKKTQVVVASKLVSLQDSYLVSKIPSGRYLQVLGEGRDSP